MSRRYAIIGTGAIGGFYGGLLQQSGQEVHYLLHNDYAWVRERGLVVESINRILYLPRVHAWKDPSDLPPCDVVIVALKTTQNGILPAVLPRALAPDGVVLVLQNGLGIEDQIATLAGPDRILGGLCFICANKVAPGYILHMDYGKVMIGDHAPDGRARGITPRMQLLASDFAAAGIPVELAEDLLLARWMKLVWNIPFNSLSVIRNTTTDTLMRDPRQVAQVRAIMDEVVRAAAAYGKRIDPAFVQKMLDHTARMAPYKTSMKLDYENHRPLEHEAIVGNPMRAAERAGIPAPLMRSLYEVLAQADAARLSFRKM